jgi:6-phosphogluconolactonase
MQIVTKTREEAEREAAELLRKRLSHYVEQTGNVVLGIPGGRSVGGVLGKLVETGADLSAVHLFFVDERCVDLDDERSNFSVAKASLLDPLAGRGASLPRAQVHPFRCREGVADLGVGSYERDFEKVATAFDVAVLGVGEDGHVASLFPGYPALEEQARLFVPVAAAPKPPPERMSASPRLLRTSRTILLLFFGGGKRPAFEAFLAEEGNVFDCPARLVRDNPDLWVFTDIER